MGIKVSFTRFKNNDLAVVQVDSIRNREEGSPVRGPALKRGQQRAELLSANCHNACVISFYCRRYGRPDEPHYKFINIIYIYFFIRATFGVPKFNL